MAFHARKVVVVEAGAPQRRLVEGESQPADEMQFCAGVRAQADDIAGIARDLGLEQQHVEHTGHFRQRGARPLEP